MEAGLDDRTLIVQQVENDSSAQNINWSKRNDDINQPKVWMEWNFIATPKSDGKTTSYPGHIILAVKLKEQETLVKKFNHPKILYSL